MDFELKAFCGRHGVPQWVQIVEDDHELLVDTWSPYSRRLLIDLVKKKEKVTITEFLHHPGSGLLHTASGYYANQIIIPLHADVEPAHPLTVPLLSDTKAQRFFLAGQKWLYCKIYTGKYLSDRLLATTIRDFCREMRAAGWIEKWFFVRYEDPQPHLRIRFYHATRPKFWQEILRRLSVLLVPYLVEKTVLRFQTESYERELERYAVKNYNDIETVFFADSVAVADLINVLQTDPHDCHRWLIALRSIDQLLEDLGFSLQDKYDLTTLLRNQFFHEFDGDVNLTKSMDLRYRTEKERIKGFMNAKNDSINQMRTIQEILDRRTCMLKKLRDCLIQSPGGTVAPDLAGNLLHMSLNRLFGSNQRAQELVIYHFLSKYFQSEMKYFSKQDRL